MPLCWICEQITPWTLKPIEFDGVRIQDPTLCNAHHRSFQYLEDSASNCELCKLVFDSFLHTSKTLGRDIRREDPLYMGAWMQRPRDSESDAPQLSKIVVQCGEVDITLLAFADPCSEAALVQDVVGRLPPEAESKVQYEMVARWLHECMHDHPACRLTAGQGKLKYENGLETVELPSRVLDVGTSIESKIRLTESSGMEGQYTVLSHRWPTDPSQHFTTTTTTLPNRKSAIRLEEMPQTFQDAVKVSRELGIRYLWIDSLCIIQDDARDWEQQSMLMGKIYYQGTVTIMAASKSITTLEPEWDASPIGFLRRPALSLPTVKMDYYDRNWSLKGNWFIRHQKRSNTRHWELFTRGWVVQEELLSRRKVLYTQERISWHCKSTTIFDVERERYNKFVEQSPKGWEDHYFVGHWLSSAEMFSERSLTFESDMLPALSGIAAHFSKRHGQDYYAGIFSGSILEGLLWRPSYAGCLSRPAKYIAPSWSWTSLIGPIKNDILGVKNVETGLDKAVVTNLLEDIHFKLYPESENIYGRLIGGKMELTGWLKRAEIYREESIYPLVLLRADGKRMALFLLDLLEDAPAALSAVEVRCLYVLTDTEKLYVLVLRGTKTDKEYERIGVTIADPAWFEEGDARKESIVIR
ncbi:heterokaryon incompatibility protein-domain-containing protein [Amylocarpus encephaloides]|uniref:Heterokaryon incompatibility protein-domain-containing protein n=1 Tax=Amylocarpus encephaloides TaxID=45428 RepID=A0A9P7YAG8_9HELO|nr:heterokaryon incompatibility protein-domain-containing protein [Amylocarpus encephaloides]